MAFSIVADDERLPPSPGTIARSSETYCDVYCGAGEDLVGAGYVTHEQLRPQFGRAAGAAAFHADGRPCPSHMRAWREPGFMQIQQTEDGIYRVKVTVGRDVQLARRRARKLAEQNAERVRIADRIAAERHLYRNWTLQQECQHDSEQWVGTKTQLQAAGLGVGMSFPGEPGAPKILECTCPLGFEFRIYQGDAHRAAATAEGIYFASSLYLPSSWAHKADSIPFAPGVQRSVWDPACWWGGLNYDTYSGTAAALIEAGLVPALRFFPGQPGANKVRASYREDWSYASNAKSSGVVVSIRRGRRDTFVVEVVVNQTERKRREYLLYEDREKHAERNRTLAEQRASLRQQARVHAARQPRASARPSHLNLVWNGSRGQGGIENVATASVHDRAALPDEVEDVATRQCSESMSRTVLRLIEMPPRPQ